MLCSRTGRSRWSDRSFTRNERTTLARLEDVRTPLHPVARPVVAAVSALTAIALPLLVSIRASAQTPTVDSPVSRPNVLLIVTDDQRWDTLDAMPIVERELAGKGISFSDAFVSNPLCCPSRASILTGNYSHTTGVYRQTPPFGAFRSFRDTSTLATWLHDAGYRTGLFGKYIDAYQHHALTGYVPPGWDRWLAFVHASYYDYVLTDDGEPWVHGHDPVTDYSTTVLGEAVEDFILSAPPDQPIFAEFAPAAPHDPAIAEPEFGREFGGIPRWRPPSYDEPDISDKPSYMQDLPRLSGDSVRWTDGLRRRQYQTLQSVDRQVGRILRALKVTGRLENTVIVFTSDNGLLWGEHRWTKKEVPYDEALHVPMIVRADSRGLAPRTDDQLVLNIDIAPTIADLADVEHPATEGMSMAPLLADPRSPWRTDFLIEHMQGTNPVPSYCGVRSRTHKYVRYVTGERELYDLETDPGEMVNVVDDPTMAADVGRLDARLDELCDPAPPGMNETGSTPAAVALVGLAGLTGSAACWLRRERSGRARPRGTSSPPRANR